MEQFLTVTELGELLKVKPSTIYHWTSAGFIPHIKVGRFIRFRASEVEQWLQRHQRHGRTTMAIQD